MSRTQGLPWEGDMALAPYTTTDLRVPWAPGHLSDTATSPLCSGGRGLLGWLEDIPGAGSLLVESLVHLAEAFEREGS